MSDQFPEPTAEERRSIEALKAIIAKDRAILRGQTLCAGLQQDFPREAEGFVNVSTSQARSFVDVVRDGFEKLRSVLRPGIQRPGDCGDDSGIHGSDGGGCHGRSPSGDAS
jgi:hypothetical protein